MGAEPQFIKDRQIRGPARQALIELFGTVFEEIELRQFAYTLYVPLNAYLPAKVGLRELAFYLVEAMERHNMIDEGLFRTIIARKPLSEEDVHHCAKLWGIELSDEKRGDEPPRKKREESGTSEQLSEKEPIFSLDIRFRGRRIFIGISVLASMFEPTRPEPPNPLSIVIADEPGIQHPFIGDMVDAYGEPPSPARPTGTARFHPAPELIELALEPCAQDALPYDPLALRVASEPESWDILAVAARSPRADTEWVLRNLSDCVRDRMRFFRPVPGLQFSVTFQGATRDISVYDFGITQEP